MDDKALEAMAGFKKKFQDIDKRFPDIDKYFAAHEIKTGQSMDTKTALSLISQGEIRVDGIAQKVGSRKRKFAKLG